MRISTQPDGEAQLTAAPVAPRKPRAAKPAAPKPHADWSYDGESGPQSWGRLKPEFSKCASGSRQSPIDIRDGIRVDLEPVEFNYQ